MLGTVVQLGSCGVSAVSRSDVWTFACVEDCNLLKMNMLVLVVDWDCS